MYKLSKNERGFVDPLSLIAIAFLVVTTVIGVSQVFKTQNIFNKAADLPCDARDQKSCGGCSPEKADGSSYRCVWSSVRGVCRESGNVCSSGGTTATTPPSTVVGNSYATCTGSNYAWCGGCGGFCIQVSGTTCSQEIQKKCGETTPTVTCNASTFGAIALYSGIGDCRQCLNGTWEKYPADGSACKITDLTIIPTYLQSEYDAAKLALTKTPSPTPKPTPSPSPSPTTKATPSPTPKPINICSVLTCSAGLVKSPLVGSSDLCECVKPAPTPVKTPSPTPKATLVAVASGGTAKPTITPTKSPTPRATSTPTEVPRIVKDDIAFPTPTVKPIATPTSKPNIFEQFISYVSDSRISTTIPATTPTVIPRIAKDDVAFPTASPNPTNKPSIFDKFSDAFGQGSIFENQTPSLGAEQPMIVPPKDVILSENPQDLTNFYKDVAVSGGAGAAVAAGTLAVPFIPQAIAIATVPTTGQAAIIGTLSQISAIGTAGYLGVATLDCIAPVSQIFGKDNGSLCIAGSNLAATGISTTPMGGFVDFVNGGAQSIVNIVTQPKKVWDTLMVLGSIRPVQISSTVDEAPIALNDITVKPNRQIIIDLAPLTENGSSAVIQTGTNNSISIYGFGPINLPSYPQVINTINVVQSMLGVPNITSVPAVQPIASSPSKFSTIINSTDLNPLPIPKPAELTNTLESAPVPTSPTAPVTNPISQWISNAKTTIQNVFGGNLTTEKLDEIVTKVNNVLNNDIVRYNSGEVQIPGYHPEYGCNAGLCGYSSDYVAIAAQDRNLTVIEYQVADLNLARGIPQDMSFRHVFAVIDDGKSKYLTDLTFDQFVDPITGNIRHPINNIQSGFTKDDPLVRELLEKGYVKLDDEVINHFLQLTSGGEVQPITSLDILNAVQNNRMTPNFTHDEIAKYAPDLLYTPPTPIATKISQTVTNFANDVKIKILGDAPIVPGETFDPEIEVNRILSAPDRDVALANFKAKLSYQQKGIADMQTQIENAINKNPEIPYKDLSAMIMRGVEKYGLTEYQLTKFYDGVNLYIDKHEFINTLFEKYPNQIDFYEAMFGQKPKGKISITKEPMAIHITVSNPYDFAYLHNFEAGVQQKTLSSTDINNSSSSLGFLLLDDNLIEGTKNLVYVEMPRNLISLIKYPNNATATIHEEQHVIHSILKDVDIFPDETNSTEEYLDFRKSLETGNKDYMLSKLNNYLATTRGTQESETADEILAFYKDGSDINDIYRSLTNSYKNGGHYDFFGIRKDRLSTFLQTSTPLDLKDISTSLDSIFTNQIIADGLQATQTLMSKNYTRDEVINILQKYPLSDWPKVAERARPQSDLKSFVNTAYSNAFNPTEVAMLTYRGPAYIIISAIAGTGGRYIYEKLPDSYKTCIKHPLYCVQNYLNNLNQKYLSTSLYTANSIVENTGTKDSQTKDNTSSGFSEIIKQPVVPVNAPVVPKVETTQSHFYTQTDSEFANEIITTSDGPRPFKYIGCGPTAVANILSQLHKANLTPIQVASMVDTQDWGYDGTYLFSNSSLTNILTDYNVDLQLYNKSFYNLQKYVEPNSLIFIGGTYRYQGRDINHIAYLQYTGDPNKIILKDDLLIQNGTCKVIGDEKLECASENGEKLTIDLNDRPVYTIPPQ